ncbi:MAG: sodium/proline symporter [Thermoanaerobaculia bacterium]
MIAWTAVLYLAVMVAIGLWAARRTRSSRDFFIAGQSLGLVVTALATMSAAFSGFVFVGGPGLTYRMGTSSLFICASIGFTPALLCWTVGRRLRRLAAAPDVLTIPDVVLARWGDRRASGLAALTVLVGSVAYLGAQIQAVGVVLEAVFGARERLGELGLPAMMLVGVAVVVAYSTAGGMVAGVYTDLVQGLLMMVAAVAIFAAAMTAGGGMGRIVDAIAASDRFGSAFLDPTSGVPLWTALGFFFVFSIGTLGQPQMLHKFFMLRDPRALRWMPLVLGGSQTVVLLLWVGLGLAVPALVASGALAPLASPDEATPAFLLSFVPGWLAGLTFAGLLAAVMSTADSFLNLAAAALVRDLPRALGREPRDELARARRVVIALAAGSAAVAWAYGDLVALLGTFAFGTLAAALAPAMALGLAWDRVSGRAATFSMAAGLVVNLGLELAGKAGHLLGAPPAVLPSALALGVSLAVLLAAGWLGAGEPRGA